MSLASRIAEGFVAVADKFNDLHPPVDTTNGFRSVQGKDGLWVPEGWGKSFLNNSDVIVFGDSVTEQWSATNHINGYIQLWESACQAIRGNGGSGWISSSLVQAGVQSFLPGAVTPVRVANFANWYNALANGYGGTEYITITVGEWIEFDGYGDSIDVMYERAGTLGTIRVDVDGVTKQNNFSTAGSGPSTQKLSIAHGMGSGFHTVRITNLTGGGCGINGVIFRNADHASGVRFHNYARSGAVSSYPQSLTYTGQPTQLAAIGTHARPAHVGLVVIAFGINDANADVTETAFFDNYRAILDAMGYSFGYLTDKAGGHTVLDYLFIMQPFQGVNNTRYDRYYSAIRRLRDWYGGALYNAHARVMGTPSSMVDLGLAASGDPVHPTTTGHAWLAQPLIDNLAG